MASLNGFPPPVRSGTSEDGSASFLWKSNSGHVLRLRLPGPDGHEGELHVFERRNGEPVSIQRIRGSLKFIQVMVGQWLGHGSS